MNSCTKRLKIGRQYSDNGAYTTTTIAKRSVLGYCARRFSSLAVPISDIEKISTMSRQRRTLLLQRLPTGSVRTGCCSSAAFFLLFDWDAWTWGYLVEKCNRGWELRPLIYLGSESWAKATFQISRECGASGGEVASTVQYHCTAALSSLYLNAEIQKLYVLSAWSLTELLFLKKQFQ